MRVIARCPAKINLVLRVRGRLSDGHHELETVFQAVDLWDVLEARPAERVVLTCDDPRVPRDDANLVVRAARLLAEHTGREDGAAFRLRKRIPPGGGMGGGSSDAAATLLILSRLWGVRLPATTAEGLARRLGADVAFFLTGGTALGTGRGDRITPLPGLPETAVLLGMPPFAIPTAEVYRRFDPRLTPPGNGVSVARFSTHKLPGGKDFGFVVNDLEDVVFEGWPELRTFRDALLASGAARAGVSGSGSTMFGIFTERDRLTAAAAGLRRAYPEWRLRPCRTIRGGVRVRACLGTAC